LFFLGIWRKCATKTLLVAMPLCSLALATAFGVCWCFFATPPPIPQLDYSVRVFDRHGKPLRFFPSRDGYWRFQVRVAEVDPRFVAALIACEDQRFRSHYGVDLLALFRATGQFLRHGRVISGASTITMQTVRLLRPQPRTLWNKATEMVAALRLERLLDKERILELYLSLAPYGGNLQGIEAASLFYFGQSARRLAPSEIALLIALPQAPERRRPDRHPALARAARDRILARLANAGVLSAQDVRAAKSSPVSLARRQAPFHAPHIADRLRQSNPGRTTLAAAIDGPLQGKLENLALAWQREMEEGATLAALVVDHRRMELIAHLGSGDFFRVSQLDLTRAIRSPGSTLKPFIYGLAFEDGFLQPQTLVYDGPTRFGLFHPTNFSGDYQGWLSAAEALRRSLNTPAVRILNHLGPARLERRLAGAVPEQRFDGESGLSLALGGVGLSLWDLTGLYCALANGGVFTPVRLTVATKTGRRGQAILSPQAARQVDGILRRMPFADGAVDGKIRFKTGTSYGFRDAWALGYNSGYTVAVWVGRPDGGYGKGETGGSLAAPLMRRVFAVLPETAHEEPPPPFTANADLPPPLRRFAGGPAKDEEQPPTIIFPPDDATLAVGAGARLLRVAVAGGRPPWRWLLNGRPLTSQDGLAPRLPEGEEGLMELVVIDENGRAGRARFRLHRQ
jgi:penicillin-binding protein 1C